MSLISEIETYLADYQNVSQVIASVPARQKMAALLIKLNIDPNTNCIHCLKGKYSYLQSIVNNNLKHMSEQTKKPDGHQGKRYWLPQDKKVMPFNTGTFYDNSTITDELVEKFDKMNPGFKKAFIDTWTEVMPENVQKGLVQPDHTPPLQAQDEKEKPALAPEMQKTAEENEKSLEEKPALAPDAEIQNIDYEAKDPERYHSYEEAYTVAKLEERYQELTGKKVAGRATKKSLIFSIMKEEDALKQI